MSDTPEHRVFGDWRDLRSAIDKTLPEFRALPETERTRLWSFAEGVIGNYAPMTAQCLSCRDLIPWDDAYRCADCRQVLCETCIRPHFSSKAPTAPDDTGSERSEHRDEPKPPTSNLSGEAG